MMPAIVSVSQETRAEGRTVAKSWFEEAGKVRAGTGRKLGRYGIVCGGWNNERGKCGTPRGELERTTQGCRRWPLVAATRVRYTRRKQDHVPTEKSEGVDVARSRSSQFRGGRSWSRKGTRRFG